MVGAIGHVGVPSSIRGDRGGAVEARRKAIAIGMVGSGSRRHRVSAAGQGTDLFLVGAKFADLVVAAVRDDDVACAGHGHPTQTEAEAGGGECGAVLIADAVGIAGKQRQSDCRSGSRRWPWRGRCLGRTVGAATACGQKQCNGRGQQGMPSLDFENSVSHGNSLVFGRVRVLSSRKKGRASIATAQCVQK